MRAVLRQSGGNIYGGAVIGQHSGDKIPGDAVGGEGGGGFVYQCIEYGVELQHLGFGRVHCDRSFCGGAGLLCQIYA